MLMDKLNRIFESIRLHYRVLRSMIDLKAKQIGKLFNFVIYFPSLFSMDLLVYFNFFFRVFIDDILFNVDF